MLNETCSALNWTHILNKTKSVLCNCSDNVFVKELELTKQNPLAYSAELLNLLMKKKT